MVLLCAPNGSLKDKEQLFCNRIRWIKYIGYQLQEIRLKSDKLCMLRNYQVNKKELHKGADHVGSYCFMQRQ